MAMVAATRVAGSSAAGAAGGTAARTSAKATTGKAAGATKAKATTAADRGRELIGEGKSRKDAARVLRDEFGSTLTEAEGVLPAPDTGGAAADPPPAAPPATNPAAGPSLPKAPRSVTSAVNAGGGAILGALTYVLALTYLRGGRAGVKTWLRAKFLNQVSS